MSKKLLSRIITPIIVLVALIVANIIIRNNALSIIQIDGVRQYHAVIRTLNIFSIILLMLCVSSIIFFILRERRRQKLMMEAYAEQEMKEKHLQREEEMQSAKLSVARPLQEDVIYSRLMNWTMNASYSNVHDFLLPIQNQLQDMNEYQSKLDNLLRNNGATYLSDSTEMLNQVEQYLLRNVRKILNCLDVYDLSDSSDIQKLESLAHDVYEDNAIQLKNVKEFLFATTDFLNRQGDDNTGIKTLNLYKKTILDSIKEDSVSEPKL